jgi:hypothetical protein
MVGMYARRGEHIDGPENLFRTSSIGLKIQYLMRVEKWAMVL